MNRTVLFSLAFGLIFLLSSCKSKQRVVQITGADIEAIEDAQEPSMAEKDYSIDSERTIDEKFSLSEGSQDTFYKTYHVVVGSFSIQKNAKNLKNTLEKEGNTPLLVVNETGMYRVLIASYDTYDEAKAKIAQIKNRFADAWVLRQK